MLKIITTIWNNTVKFVTVQSNYKDNLSTAIFLEMKLSLTSVYTQQKSYQTSKHLKTILRLHLNSNNPKYKHLENFSHTMSHKATNLPISMGC
jgi:hypothetical protein